MKKAAARGRGFPIRFKPLRAGIHTLNQPTISVSENQ